MSQQLVLGPDLNGIQVVIEGDRLVALGAPDALPPLAADAVRVPCPEATLAPGWVCAHTHLYSGLAPLGLPTPAVKPENFVQILERIWWRLDRALDPDALRASARYYVANALLSGTTVLIDHHESPNLIEGSLDILADACQELGIRAAVCYGATERNGGREEGRRGLAECARFVRENRRPLVRGLVSLHASFTVSDDTVREAGRLCEALSTPMHVHVAEADSDVADARQRGYGSPVDRLEKLGALPAGSILAHGVYATPDEVRRTADAGCWWVQNPRSNEGNEVGYAGVLRNTRRSALGTDGYPAEMRDEEAALERLAAAHDDDVATARDRLPTGWKLAGELFEAPMGPWSAFVAGEPFAGDVVAWKGERAQHVVVAGRLVVRDGRLLTGDHAAIAAEAAVQAPALWARMARY